MYNIIYISFSSVLNNIFIYRIQINIDVCLYVSVKLNDKSQKLRARKCVLFYIDRSAAGGACRKRFPLMKRRRRLLWGLPRANNRHAPQVVAANARAKSRRETLSYRMVVFVHSHDRNYITAYYCKRIFGIVLL